MDMWVKMGAEKGSTNSPPAANTKESKKEGRRKRRRRPTTPALLLHKGHATPDRAALAAAVALLLLFPLLISPRSLSSSLSFVVVNTNMLFPSPPRACPWCPAPPFTLRLPPAPPAVPPGPPLPPSPDVPPLPPGGWEECVEVKGRGKGEGRSSTEREWGLRKGPVNGRLLLWLAVPFAVSAVRPLGRPEMGKLKGWWEEPFR